MIKRDILQAFDAMMKKYPAVTLTGPRQSGKTTFIRTHLPNKPYFNLEQPDTRDRILTDPKTFFNSLQDGAILDEIQNAPELLSYIQVIVDELKIAGMFVLTGSHQFQLHEAISQSLSGRTALLELLPLTINELSEYGITATSDRYLFKGFYPAIYDRNLSPEVHYRNYLKTYVKRDIRQIVNVRNLDIFRRFIQLASGRIGSI